MTKVITVASDYIEFDNGFKLYSDHDQDCCEHHYLCLDDISLNDFQGLEFDLSDLGEDSARFFRRIDGYGIELVPVHGHSVRIPGYASNNGYYGSNLDLVIEDENGIAIKVYNIDNCQSDGDEF